MVFFDISAMGDDPSYVPKGGTYDYRLHRRAFESSSSGRILPRADAMPMQSPPDRSSAPERGTIDQTVTDKGHTGATSLAHPTVPVSPPRGLDAARVGCLSLLSSLPKGMVE
jgi:hypothetical protein